MPEQNQQYENSLELFCFFLLVMHAYNRLADVEFYVSCILARHTNSCVKQTSRKATNVRKSLTYPSSSIVKYSNLSEI